MQAKGVDGGARRALWRAGGRQHGRQALAATCVTRPLPLPLRCESATASLHKLNASPVMQLTGPSAHFEFEQRPPVVPLLVLGLGVLLVITMQLWPAPHPQRGPPEGGSEPACPWGALRAGCLR